ncbi:MAG TPA: SDR family NAD(P)-dependent oxidoreductase [Dongiaceae bacterium]|nr:SDR family NAD(P)-dependent oxidoreductase [Dongiaceae bacterium]
MESNRRLFAVVTGASKGIGYELARVFAKNGYDLLVNADSEQIEEAGRELESLGVKVQAVQADLAKYEGVEKLWAAVESTGRPVDAIAINAGVGVGGSFLETDLEEELNLIQLSVTSSVHLAKLAVRQMAARGAGKILFTSSIAGTMPAPLEAVYGASKAFVLSFSKSLRYELKDTGITVTALQPGPTDTNFFHRAGMDDTKLGQEGKYTNDPAEVAQQGYDALIAGKDHIYASSMKTKVQGELGKFIPESTKARLHEKQAEPKPRKAS